VPQDTEDAALEEYPNHDDKKSVASFLTEFGQQKTPSPLSQGAEEFTPLFKEFE